MYDAIRNAMGVKNEQDVDEISLFKGTDNNSVKEQDPKQTKSIRLDCTQEMTVKNIQVFTEKVRHGVANLFLLNRPYKKVYEQSRTKSRLHVQIKQALTNIATTGKLFDRVGVKYPN